MRIVFVGPFAMRPKGTVKARALPMAQALAARGHHVTVLIPPWDWPADAGSSYSAGQVAVVNVRLGPRLPALSHLLIVLRLLRELLRRNPDVVHVFKPKGYSGAVATLLRPLRAAGLTRARIVVDTDDWEGRGGWNDLAGYSPLLRLLFPLQERVTLRAADAVTVASRALTQLLLGQGLSRSRTFYVPNGPSEPAARWLASSSNAIPAGAECAVGNHLLLYTRFLEFEPTRVAEILRRICQEIPDAELWVAGSGFRGEEGRFSTAMATCGLTDRVHMLGWLGADEIAAYLARAKVGICPYEDNLVNRAKCSAKLIELLSFGLPVVADRVGQNCEYIEHGSSGLLIEPHDVEAFAEAVVRLLRDEPLRRRLAVNARRRILEHFLWPALVAEVEAAYQC